MLSAKSHLSVFLLGLSLLAFNLEEGLFCYVLQNCHLKELFFLMIPQALWSSILTPIRGLVTECASSQFRHHY